MPGSALRAPSWRCHTSHLVHSSRLGSRDRAWAAPHTLKERLSQHYLLPSACASATHCRPLCANVAPLNPQAAHEWLFQQEELGPPREGSRLLERLQRHLSEGEAPQEVAPTEAAVRAPNPSPSPNPNPNPNPNPSPLTLTLTPNQAAARVRETLERVRETRKSRVEAAP